MLGRLTMRRLVFAMLFTLAPTSSWADRRCNVDLEPIVTLHFRLRIVDDATTAVRTTAGELLLSRGGAATIMRTDARGCGKPSQVLANWRLDEGQRLSLEQALSETMSVVPSEPCL